MTAYVVKLLDSDSVHRFSRRPFNFILSLPVREEVVSIPSGSDVWILSDQRDSKTIHQFFAECEVGFTEGRLIIAGDPTASFAVEPSNGMISDWPNEPFLRITGLSIEVSQIDDEYSKELKNRLSRKAAVRSSNDNFLLKVRSQFPENQSQKLASDGHLLNVFLRRMFFINELETKASNISSLDPFHRLLGQFDLSLTPAPKVESSLEFEIATSIRDLTEESFLSRMFSDAQGTGQSMAKTQIAEYLHQEILREVGNELASFGLSLGETNSVDLVASSPGSLILFEVKSATSENLQSQFDHGVMQLLRYREAFVDLESNVNVCLVLGLCSQKTRIGAVPMRVLAHVGVKLVCWCACHPDVSKKLLAQVVMSRN